MIDRCGYLLLSAQKTMNRQGTMKVIHANEMIREDRFFRHSDRRMTVAGERIKNIP